MRFDCGSVHKVCFPVFRSVFFLCARICVFPYVRSSCALICVFSYVCCHVCAPIVLSCVLSYVCFHMCALICVSCVLSCVCSHLRALIHDAVSLTQFRPQHCLGLLPGYYFSKALERMRQLTQWLMSLWRVRHVCVFVLVGVY